MADKQTLLAQIADRQRVLKADIAERQARREAGEEIEWQLPPEQPATRKRGLDTIPTDVAAVDGLIARALDAFVAELEGDIFTKIGQRLREHDSDVDELRAEVGQLRAAVALLENLQKGNVELLRKASSDADAA